MILLFHLYDMVENKDRLLQSELGNSGLKEFQVCHKLSNLKSYFEDRETMVSESLNVKFLLA